MAGKAAAVSPMWKQLSKHLDLDPPTKFDGGVYLGCGQHDVPIPVDLVVEKQEILHPYLASTGNKTAAEVKDFLPSKAEGNSRSSARRIKAWQYKMHGHAERCVQKYLELSGMAETTLKKVTTPNLDDHQLQPEDFETKGKLSHVASRVVLTALYLARLSRPDLLWTVNVLAREVMTWNVACDKRLHRLISYLNHTKEYSLINYIGDDPEDIRVVIFSDASFAADLRDSKSTTGGLVCLVGPNTFVTLTWMCKKQGAISHSSTEAEIIALDALTRMEGLPGLVLWEAIIDVLGSSPPQSRRKLSA